MKTWQGEDVLIREGVAIQGRGYPASAWDRDGAPALTRAEIKQALAAWRKWWRWHFQLGEYDDTPWTTEGNARGITHD